MTRLFHYAEAVGATLDPAEGTGCHCRVGNMQQCMYSLSFLSFNEFSSGLSRNASTLCALEQTRRTTNPLMYSTSSRSFVFDALVLDRLCSSHGPHLTNSHSFSMFVRVRLSMFVKSGPSLTNRILIIASIVSSV